VDIGIDPKKKDKSPYRALHPDEQLLFYIPGLKSSIDVVRRPRTRCLLLSSRSLEHL